MSGLRDISQTPIRTTLVGAISILVPTALVIFASSIYLVNSDRDRAENREDIDDNTRNLAIITANQAQNTIDLSVVINEVKNTDQSLQQLMSTVNAILESL